MMPYNLVSRKYHLKRAMGASISFGLIRYFSYSGSFADMPVTTSFLSTSWFMISVDSLLSLSIGRYPVSRISRIFWSDSRVLTLVPAYICFLTLMKMDAALETVVVEHFLLHLSSSNLGVA